MTCSCGVALPEGRRCRLCRDCQREHVAGWVSRNRERANAYGRRWRAEKKTGVKLEPPWTPRVCRRCQGRLPGARRTPYCSTCDRRYRRDMAALPNRRCSACRDPLPAGRLSHYCLVCDRAARIARTMRPDRLCSGHCGKLLPVGYRHNLCGACQHDYREKLKGKPRLCTQCRDLIPKQWSGYLCRDCESIRGVEKRNRRRAAREAEKMRPVAEARTLRRIEPAAGFSGSRTIPLGNGSRSGGVSPASGGP